MVKVFLRDQGIESVTMPLAPDVARNRHGQLNKFIETLLQDGVWVERKGRTTIYPPRFITKIEVYNGQEVD